MECKIKKVMTSDIKYLHINIGVRYLEDADINGIEAKEDGSDTPFFDKEDKRVKFTIDMDDGKVLNFPDSIEEWKMTYKVCDDGVYSYYTKNKELVKKMEYEYVPCILGIDDHSYGDYVVMTVKKGGTIKNWKCDRNILETIINNEEE